MERTWPLNERQLEVLGLVGGGDDLSNTARVGFRNTARALQSRGLVTVSKAGGRWRATVTDAGRYYLEHGSHPDAETGDAKSVQAPCQRARSGSVGSARFARPAGPGERHGDATELMAQLLEDRSVELFSLSEAEQGIWRKTIDYARRHGLVPEGHSIACTVTGNGTMLIRLVASTRPRAAQEEPANLPPVPIPTGLEHAHPVVSALIEDTERLNLPAELRHRSLVILHSIASAALEREWEVTESPAVWHAHQTHLPNPPVLRAGAIRIGIDGCTYTVTIDQAHPKATDPVKSGYLAVTLPQTRSGAQSRWADRTAQPLEQHLPEVIDALARRAVEDIAHTLSRQAAAAAQRITAETALAGAREQARKRFLAEELERQAFAFQRWQTITAYCQQLETQLLDTDPQAPEYESARQWLTWAQAHVQAIDPFKDLPGMPIEPESRPDEPMPGLEQKLPDPMPIVHAGKWPASHLSLNIRDGRRRFRPNE